MYRQNFMPGSEAIAEAANAITTGSHHATNVSSQYTAPPEARITLTMISMYRTTLFHFDFGWEVCVMPPGMGGGVLSLYFDAAI